MRRIRPLLAVLLAFAALSAACSSGDDNAGVDDAPSTYDSDAPTTTDQPDDTTTTSSLVDLGDLAPLTGLTAEAGEDLDRPALAVKIDNHPNARPQTALDQADIVFEMRAEGVTRFMAVFHSNQPDTLGPVRSSRTSDFDLLRGLDNPLYASSGGNDSVAGSLRSLPIYEVTAISQRAYTRDGSRPAPHNLFTSAESMFALAPDDAAPPAPWFTYRHGDEEQPGTAVAVDGPVTIRYRGSPVVTHAWDAESGGWARTQDGRPHTSVAGDQLAPENVVIMVTSYVTSPADAASPELVSTGGGALFVLTDGVLIEGTWTRTGATDKPELLDTDGNEILLTPGRTWVLYPESGQVTLP